MSALRFDGLHPKQADDIADDGTPIFHEKPSPAVRLGTQIARLRSSSSVPADVTKSIKEDSKETENNAYKVLPDTSVDMAIDGNGVKKKEGDEVATEKTAETIPLNTFRRELADSIFHAEAEVLVLLDLFNVVLGESHQAPLPLPPKTLGGTRLAAQVRTKEERRADEVLQFGIRKLQLSKISELLKNGVDRLAAVADGEKRFWREVSELQRNLWPLTAGAGVGNTRSLQVDYGYRDVGSTSQELSRAELLRASNEGVVSQEGDKSDLSIDLVLPHSAPFNVSVEIWERKDGHHKQLCGSSANTLVNTTNDADIRTRLAQARATLFDSELFQEIVREARIGGHGETIMEDRVCVPINDRYETVITWSLPPSTEDNDRDMEQDENHEQSTTATMLVTLMRLLLRRRHHVRAQRHQQIHRTTKRSRNTNPDPSEHVLRNAIRPFRRLEQERAFRRTLDITSKAFAQIGVPVHTRFEQTPLDDSNDGDEARWLIVTLFDHGPIIRFVFRDLRSFELHVRGTVVPFSDLAQFPHVLAEEMGIACLSRIAHILSDMGLDKVQAQPMLNVVTANVLYTKSMELSEPGIIRITLDRPKWQGDDSLHLAFRSEYTCKDYSTTGDTIELSSIGGNDSNTTTPLDASVSFDTRVRRVIVKTIHW